MSVKLFAAASVTALLLLAGCTDKPSTPGLDGSLCAIRPDAIPETTFTPYCADKHGGDQDECLKDPVGWYLHNESTCASGIVGNAAGECCAKVAAKYEKRLKPEPEFDAKAHLEKVREMDRQKAQQK